VTEAQGGLPHKGSVSSYGLGAGSLALVSASIPDYQTAACWITLTGSTAWVVNTATATLSSYSVNDGDGLSLENPVAASTGQDTFPTDVGSSSDRQFVYVIKSAGGDLAGYHVNGDSLAHVFELTGLPYSIAGIAVQ
jgi:hypothetical protein